MCFCFKGNIACNITKKTMIYDTLKTYFYPDPALFFLIFKHYFILNKIKCLNFYACLCHVLFKKWNFFEKSWRHSVPGKFIMFLLFKVSKRSRKLNFRPGMFFGHTFFNFHILLPFTNLHFALH